MQKLSALLSNLFSGIWRNRKEESSNEVISQNQDPDPCDSTGLAELRQPVSLSCTDAEQSAFTTLELQRDLLVWRDESISRVALHFYDRFSDLENQIENEISEYGFFEKRFKKESIKHRVDRCFQKWLQQQYSNLVKQAQHDLNCLLENNVAIREPKSQMHDRLSSVDTSATDARFIAGYGASAAGAGVIAATPALATTSAGGIAGLFGATVISGPVVWAGLGVGLMAMFVSKKAGEAAEEKLFQTFSSWYREVVFGPRKSGLSVCEKIEKTFSEEYQRVVLEVSQND